MKISVTVDEASRKVLKLHILEDGEQPPIEPKVDGRAHLLVELAGEEQLGLLRAGFWGIEASTGALVELPFKVAVLDEEDVYMDKIELGSSAQILPSHIDLRTRGLGGDCDLAFGKYRWDREGSTFVPLPKAGQRSTPSGVSLERALADFLEQSGLGKLPKSTRAWVEQYRNSNDVRKKGR